MLYPITAGCNAVNEHNGAFGSCVQHLGLHDGNKHYTVIIVSLYLHYPHSKWVVGKVNQRACKSSEIHFLHAASIDRQES